MNILLTGANGYIGMRLLPLLIQAGHTVYCLVRNKARFPYSINPGDQIKIVEGNLLKSESLLNLPEEIDLAYYLVHSMSDRVGNFSEMEHQSAENFIRFLDKTSCTQIIYLSGIANEDQLSEHLASRMGVEETLRKANAALTVLRAGIIVGSGSASFEIIRDLVEKLPVMIAPKWLNTKCQPIAIRNVIEYLNGAAHNPLSYNQIFDIGGPEVLTYREMLLQFAEVRGLKRYILTLPILTPKLSSLWLYFVTATSYNLARNLVDSMKVDVVAKNDKITAIIPIVRIPYKESVQLAFKKIKQNSVISSWKDSVVTTETTFSDVEDFLEVPTHGCFTDVKERSFERASKDIVANIWQIGGEHGWYYGTLLWKIRGYLDKLVGGIGLRRGRRSPTEIFPGDALDFWRVIVASKQKKRLLLYAEMKLPGEAWLEFKINEGPSGNSLIQTATFRPKGLLGRLYWYAVWPFHVFVFRGMIENIIAYRKKKAP